MCLEYSGKYVTAKVPGDDCKLVNTEIFIDKKIDIIVSRNHSLTVILCTPVSDRPRPNPTKIRLRLA